MPTRPGHSRASFLSASRSNLPSGACAITAFGMPLMRMRLVSARVSMPQSPITPRRLEPLVEVAGGAVVRRRGDVGVQDDAARARRRREVDGLDVLLVGADIADMREREGDDLPGIGRIGEDFLVAGHRGVEADLADRVAGRAEPHAFQHGAVGEHQERGRDGFRPGGMSCLAVMSRLHSRRCRRRQRGQKRCGLALRFRAVCSDGDADFLRVGGSRSGVYSGLRGRLRAGLRLRICPGRLAVRAGRRGWAVIAIMRWRKRTTLTVMKE